MASYSTRSGWVRSLRKSPAGHRLRFIDLFLLFSSFVVLIEAVIVAVRAFKGGAPAADDLRMLVLRRLSGA
jgi:hypothetical protein